MQPRFLAAAALLIVAAAGDAPNGKAAESIPAQLILVGVEIGLPFDIANTLGNPLGRILTAVSLVGVSTLFLLGIALVPWNIILDVLDNDGLFRPVALASRKRRSSGGGGRLFDVEDGFLLLKVSEEACRQRIVCDFNSLLADSPWLLQSLVTLLTRQVALGPYREAARLGLKSADCHKHFSDCPKANVQILSQAFPGYFKTKQRRS